MHKAVALSTLSKALVRGPKKPPLLLPFFTVSAATSAASLGETAAASAIV